LSYAPKAISCFGLSRSAFIIVYQSKGKRDAPKAISYFGLSRRAFTIVYRSKGKRDAPTSISLGL